MAAAFLGDVSALQTEISELRVELGLAKEKLANLYAEAPVLLNRNVQHAGKMFNDVFMRTLRYDVITIC